MKRLLWITLCLFILIVWGYMCVSTFNNWCIFIGGIIGGIWLDFTYEVMIKKDKNIKEGAQIWYKS